MKKILSASPVMLCFLSTVVPLCRLLGAAFEYEFLLHSDVVPIAFLAAVSVFAALLLLLTKVSVNKVNAVFSAVLPVLSVINGFCFLSSGKWKQTLVFIVLCCACAVVIFLKFAWPAALRVLFGIAFVLLSLLVLVTVDTAWRIGGFGSKTLLKSVPSPQNTYVAEVIYYDQGALGGDALVEVQNKSRTFHVLIGTFSKSPVRVYSAKLNEIELSQIKWKDEHTLVIDGKEYPASE